MNPAATATPLPPSRPASFPPRPARRHLAAALAGVLLVAATLAAYTRAGTCGFVNYDDYIYVTENPNVLGGLTLAGVSWAFTSHHADNWHPLTWLSLQLDAQLYGPNAAGSHWTNVALHAAGALLLFLALWSMTGAVWRSALVAALFALHPLHVESVAWVSERKDVLCAFFWFLALLAYARYAARPGWGRYLLVVLAFALGLLSKPMVVTLPCVLLLLDYWPLRRGQAGWGRLLAEKVPLLALAAAACLVTLRVQEPAMGPVARFPLYERLANALVSYAAYLVQAVFPAGLAAFYPYRHGGALLARAVPAALLLAGLTALVVRVRRPWATVGWLWYLGTLAPVIGLVQVGFQARADRYTYLPLVGIFLAAVWGAAELCDRWGWPALARASLAGAVLALCGLGTWQEVGYWHDSLALWQHTLDVTSENAVAQKSMAVVLNEEGNKELALYHFQEAVLLDPDYGEARMKLGIALLDEGKAAEAEPHLAAAARLLPEATVARGRLGLALVLLGRYDEARQQLEEALRDTPKGGAEAHNALGIAYLRLGRTAEAVEQFHTALDIRPQFAENRANLGTALLRQGKSAEAAAQFEQAVAERPALAAAWNGWGLALARQGRWAEAVPKYREAVHLSAEAVEYHCNLALALGRLGRKDAAAAEYARASRIEPAWPDAARQTAWELATDPDPGRRDGADAVALATEACQATDCSRPELLDVLGAACAEAGDFDQAAAWAGKAAGLAEAAGKAGLAEQYRRRESLYRRQQPFRDQRLKGAGKGTFQSSGPAVSPSGSGGASP
jgi:tetratricopeptide (TPR) repeat protein